MHVLIMCPVSQAIIFTQLFRGSEEAAGCYEGVLESMNCLMLNVAPRLGVLRSTLRSTQVFPEQQELMAKMLEAGPMTYLLGIFYLLITGLTAICLRHLKTLPWLVR